MLVKPTDINGLVVIEHERHNDSRGSFTRLFCGGALSEAGLEGNCTQINLSLSDSVGTLRGLHFQYPPNGEAKTISCITGAIYDVAVDLRPGSPTFLQSAGVHLDEDECRSLHVPKGFAHGFLTLEPATRVLYATSTPYAPLNEDGIRFDDPLLEIAWPCQPNVISPKDVKWPPLKLRIEAIKMRFERIT